MIGYRYDDGGRKAAGFKGKAGDCVVRAAAILTGRDYAEVYELMADANVLSKQRLRHAESHGLTSVERSAERGVSKDAYLSVFKELGIIQERQRRGDLKFTYTQAYERYGDCIVTTRRHMSAVIDGELRDIFDDRLYEWWETGEIRERKAMSVYSISAGLRKRLAQAAAEKSLPLP